jgi:hypothetical protein
MFLSSYFCAECIDSQVLATLDVRIFLILDDWAQGPGAGLGAGCSYQMSILGADKQPEATLPSSTELGSQMVGEKGWGAGGRNEGASSNLPKPSLCNHVISNSYFGCRTNAGGHAAHMEGEGGYGMQPVPSGYQWDSSPLV